MKRVIDEKEWVLLGQAGYPDAAIWQQVAKILNSPAFDKKDTPRRIFTHLVEEALKGHIPQAESIGAKFNSEGETFASTNTGRVREAMETYYSTHAKRGEIHLVIAPKSYILVAPRYIATATPADLPASASILEPAENSEIYAVVNVRGRIDALDPDLRPWLVVLAEDGYYYQQCRVTRRSPSWEYRVNCGRLDKGKTDGAPFEILLVAAGEDGDYKFQGDKQGRDLGFASRLPSDVRVLVTRRVVRRDIR